MEIIDASPKKSVGKRYHSELARRFREDLILDGKEPKSVKSYLAAVAHLAEHYGCSPERLSEDQIRQYLLLRSQSLKKNSMRPILAGIQFFYRFTVPRDWKTLAATRIPKSRTLPTVLLPQQVCTCREKASWNSPRTPGRYSSFGLCRRRIPQRSVPSPAPYHSTA